MDNHAKFCGNLWNAVEAHVQVCAINKFYRLARITIGVVVDMLSPTVEFTRCPRIILQNLM